MLRTLLLALLALAAPAASAATIPVTTLADELNADGDCSLREAIAAAETDAAVDACPAGSGQDEITFTVHGEIAHAVAVTITTEIWITGPGAGLLTIREAGEDGLFFVNGGTLLLNRLTLLGSPGGNAALVEVAGASVLGLGDCVMRGNESANNGGAVAVHGSGATATAYRCLFENNRTAGDGGAVSVNGPGHTFVANLSTIAGNHAAGHGGALQLVGAGSFVVENSTLSGNTANGDGGGVRAVIGGELSLRNATITANTADADTDGTGNGGGLWSGVATGFRGALIAGNVDASPGGGDYADVFLAGATSRTGPNLIGSNGGDPVTFPAGAPNANGDWVGTPAAPLNAGLGPLADNGGFTPTHLPGAASPAVDNGACLGMTVDQRGEPRPYDAPGVPNALDGCDIGAVEWQGTTTSAEGGPTHTAPALGPIHPNPFADVAVATLTVGRTQAVEVALYDALGRRVAVLFTGTAEAGAPMRLTLDGRRLPAGVYLLRVAGEDFAEARRVSLVR